MGTAQIRLDYLCSHRSKLPNQGWPEVFERTCRHPDDRHMAKMISATKLAEDVSKPYDHLPEFRVKQNMFLTAGIAMIDSACETPMTGTTQHNFIRAQGLRVRGKEFRRGTTEKYIRGSFYKLFYLRSYKSGSCSGLLILFNDFKHASLVRALYLIQGDIRI